MSSTGSNWVHFWGEMFERLHRLNWPCQDTTKGIKGKGLVLVAVKSLLCAMLIPRVKHHFIIDPVNSPPYSNSVKDGFPLRPVPPHDYISTPSATTSAASHQKGP